MLRIDTFRPEYRSQSGFRSGRIPCRIRPDPDPDWIHWFWIRPDPNRIHQIHRISGRIRIRIWIRCTPIFHCWISSNKNVICICQSSYVISVGRKKIPRERETKHFRFTFALLCDVKEINAQVSENAHAQGSYSARAVPLERRQSIIASVLSGGRRWTGNDNALMQL